MCSASYSSATTILLPDIPRKGPSKINKTIWTICYLLFHLNHRGLRVPNLISNTATLLQRYHYERKVTPTERHETKRTRRAHRSSATKISRGETNTRKGNIYSTYLVIQYNFIRYNYRSPLELIMDLITFSNFVSPLTYSLMSFEIPFHYYTSAKKKGVSVSPQIHYRHGMLVSINLYVSKNMSIILV